MSIFITKNFKRAEFACPDCDKDRPLDSKLIYLLQSLREKIKKPIYISSGLRCKKYNRKIGGYIRSPHMSGKAVDIKVKNMHIVDLALEAKEIGFSRIGIYKSFIHVDVVRPYRSASWVRDKNGNYHYFKTLEQAIFFVESIADG